MWSAASELEEAGWIASLILDLSDAGARFQDIAVLVRGRASYPRLVEQFTAFDIPVQPGGRSGLFDQPRGGAARTDDHVADRHRVARSLRPGAAHRARQRC